MRVLARSNGIRIFAVLMLLALRPCMIASAAALDNARSERPVLQDIAPEEQVHHLAHSRPKMQGAATMTAVGSALLTSLLIKLPQSFAAPAEAIAPKGAGAIVAVAGSRAPPL